MVALPEAALLEVHRFGGRARPKQHQGTIRQDPANVTNPHLNHGREVTPDIAGGIEQRDRIEADGYGHLPICMAKTQYSFSTDATALGAPSGHTVNVREVRLAAGAGFVVLVTGDIMTMPGLPRVPASDHIDIGDDGNIVGLS